ncbi:MAG: DUF4199 domain-containing protein [Rikenellaceae bacterium]
MDNKSFWNEVSKQSILLGVVMGASKMFEQSLLISGGVNYGGWILLEWLLFAFLFCSILYRATKRRAALTDSTLGYSFGHGVSYMMLISMLAAIPVTCIYYVYVNSLIGYDNYIEGLVNAIISVVQAQPLDNATSDVIDLLIEQMRSQPQASILSVLFNTIFQYAFAGLFVGLCIAGFTKRKPEIFEQGNE